ncbi:transposase of ISPca5, Y1_Tnp domain-containing [Syntrophotalea carbinolica DSM 2380]|uniref:Transposase of ISPca5, Y1_Tnp domain-containing n=1 Tax=Syntrophotalea carbinolica (strain DSM 2380 / NBRC 103641 / GraBd1) TaxID=338963 RepID=Q3A3N1_SYNC1|nr:transposase [Syntrophotalea carbinolica]ABA89026.1 transposase of ISPca5, Y1_Tnp domain-containing [Syntrophotalea carbinolica DSM 2380]
MPRTARIDHLDLLQHVMVRGIEKKPIFHDHADRIAFLQRMNLLLGETGTECLAWSLMRNHSHLLLRAGAVGDMAALDSYPWSGHAVLMGTQDLTGQNTDEVLGRFGGSLRTARTAYRQFVSIGAGQGEREELCGGGLRRVMMTGVEDKPQMYDERVLGSGEFVQGLLDESRISSSEPSILTLEILAEKVAEVFGVTVEDIRQPGRRNAVTDARSLISYLGFRRMGYSGEAVARILGITRSGVCRRSAAGEDLYRTDDSLRELFP